MSKKIWLSMHPRKFGNNVTVSVPSAPQAYQCEITQSNVFTGVNNRERGKALDTEQKRRISSEEKHEN